MYAGITLVGFVLFYITVPETKGLPIEEIEDIFRTKEEQKRHREQMVTAKVAPEEKLVPFEMLASVQTTGWIIT